MQNILCILCSIWTMDIVCAVYIDIVVDCDILENNSV